MAEPDDALKLSLEQFLRHWRRGETGGAKNTVLELMAQRGLDVKTLLFAAQLCDAYRGYATYGSGFAYGAETCSRALNQLGTELGNYLDQFGRP